MGGVGNGGRLRRRFHGQRWINERQLARGSQSSISERITDMTNTNSRQAMTRKFSQCTVRLSDEAPMVVTRLSGWIGSSGDRAPMAAWIIPTRIRAGQ